MNVVRHPDLLEHDRDLPAVRCAPRVQLNHDVSLGEVFRSRLSSLSTRLRAHSQLGILFDQARSYVKSHLVTLPPGDPKSRGLPQTTEAGSATSGVELP